MSEPSPPRPGIPNMGNTCGLNTLLQCIAHCPPIVTSILGSAVVDVGVSAGVVEPLKAFLQTPAAPPQPLVAGFFRTARDMFAYGMQHDLTELWMYLAHHLEETLGTQGLAAQVPWQAPTDAHLRALAGYGRLETLARDTLQAHRKKMSPWLSCIQGLLVSQVTCGSCDQVCHAYEPFTAITLDLAESVKHGLKNYLSPAAVAERRCDDCKRTCQADRLLRFWCLPPVMVLSWRRFQYGPHGARKRDDAVRVDPTFTLTAKSVVGPDFICHHHPRAVYELVAFGCHHGASNAGGHYTAFVRSPRDRAWWHYDDDAVSPVPPETMQTLLEANRDVYLMFYVRAPAAEGRGPRRGAP